MSGLLRTDMLLTARVREWLDSLEARGLAGTVRVFWNARLRSTAGMARPRTGTIELNPRLQGIGPGEVDRTLRHEAAHLLAHWRAGGRRIASHGPEWRRACADLGIPGEKSTHTLPLPRRRLNGKYFYQCPFCAVVVRRMRLFKRPTACLRCCRTWSGGKFEARFEFRRIPCPADFSSGS